MGSLNLVKDQENSEKCSMISTYSTMSNFTLANCVKTQDERLCKIPDIRVICNFPQLEGEKSHFDPCCV
jgi:hypothetical protein